MNRSIGSLVEFKILKAFESLFVKPKPSGEY